MSDEIADHEEALAGLRDLERELSEATNNWTTQTVARRYDPGEDGDEDRADEVMLFREHGYSASIPLGLPNDMVFKKELSASVTSPTTIVRTYRGKQQADAVAWFREDAADLAPDGYAPTSQSWAPGHGARAPFWLLSCSCSYWSGSLSSFTCCWSSRKAHSGSLTRKRLRLEETRHYPRQRLLHRP